MGQRFPKRVRLRRRAEFLAVQNHARGRKLHTRFFLLIVAPRAGDGAGRVGITVSKKVGTAVLRNRIRRLVREALRRRAGWLPDGCDVVVIAKKNAAAITGLAEVADDLARVEGRLAPC